MPDKKDDESRKALVEETAWIFGFGGIGGALVWIWEIWQKSEQFEFSQLLHLPMYVGFGAGAAAVFILLVANSDRSDRMRIVALALLAGFAWKPIWTGSQNLMGQPEKRSLIDSPVTKGPPSSTHESLPEGVREQSSYEDLAEETSGQFVARLIQAFARFIEDAGEMTENEFRGISELLIGETERVLDGHSRFRFRLDHQGRLVIHIEAPEMDLVGTLYRYDNGALEVIEIDDDSGDWYNPKFDIGVVEEGDYMLALRPFEEGDLYRGPVNIRVSRH